jgi:sortase A
MSSRARRALLFALVVSGVWLIGAGGYIHAKAWLAQQLIASAWSKTLDGGTHVRPWPWADTWPVARLRVNEANVDLYVLADASGRSLAFGPGYVNGTAELGSAGRSMIAGHRDTHFAFLRATHPGTMLSLQTSDHVVRNYRVVETHVFDSRSERLEVRQESSLTLLTCYPFDAIVPGGPMRFAVIAEVTS